MPHAVDPKPLGLPRTPLCPGRLFVFLRKPLCLLTVCFFRSDPTLPAIFIAETSRPIVRCRIFSGASHLITKLITSSAIQGFPWRLGLSESSRIKPFLDLAGHRRRKQGFNSPRLQTSPLADAREATSGTPDYSSHGRSLSDVACAPTQAKATQRCNHLP